MKEKNIILILFHHHPLSFFSFIILILYHLLPFPSSSFIHHPPPLPSSSVIILILYQHPNSSGCNITVLYNRPRNSIGLKPSQVTIDSGFNYFDIGIVGSHHLVQHKLAAASKQQRLQTKIRKIIYDQKTRI